MTLAPSHSDRSPQAATRKRAAPGAPQPGATTPLSFARTPQAQAPQPRNGWVAGWLIGPLLLSASLAGVLFVRRGPDKLFLWAVGAMIGVTLLWMFISVFFPASLDRTCPACAEQGLGRLDPTTTRGLECSRCGWRDASLSSFLMAEAEGPIEDTVLRDRQSRDRQPAPRPVSPPLSGKGHEEALR